MVIGPESQRERIAADAKSPTGSAEELVRRLVRRTAKTHGFPLWQAHDGEEIMFDIDVDGSRYLLVRLPKRERVQVVLSPREHEIARMIAKGHHNKAIAGVLNISLWTVCTHLRRIFAKLGVNSRAAMVGRLADIDIVREAPSMELTSARRKARILPHPSSISLSSVSTVHTTFRPLTTLNHAPEATKSKT